MKKKKGSRIVRILASIFNVRRWFDWDRMKFFTSYLVNGIKKFFVPQPQEQTESFEEAVGKLKLNEMDLLVKQKALYRLSVLMLVIAVIVFAYMGYQFIYGSFKATLVSFVIVLIALVLAFRYHFWYFQIKHRKLGCSIQEWYRQGLLGEKE
ncbi:type IVB secretion system protein IcmV [Legionella waltersii]|uniref:Intracellular multiplication protein IcmV n=1 Tax=Legionella waltersii TaxID=66969 RepID=A0A0W1AD41_9GAMM|nr:type IVB secretion system protein IcmV [Legionella waltersii]KTD79285.1 intracellular multiplication protein IcmV [Legionella waltersii]SNV12894.1 intracellular multiplication protein IcmV [Legionella waltersii]